jgi:hypothetical protein
VSRFASRSDCMVDVASLSGACAAIRWSKKI